MSTTEVVEEEVATTDSENTNSDDFIVPPLPSADLETLIHKFGSLRADPDSLARPIYLASGKVNGTLLDQFSMDEYKGDLRVAVNVENFRAGTEENHVKILRPKQGLLEEIGAVTGLGVDEDIYAVRFMGLTGFRGNFPSN